MIEIKKINVKNIFGLTIGDGRTQKTNVQWNQSGESGIGNISLKYFYLFKK